MRDFLSPTAWGLPLPGFKFDPSATYVRSHILSPTALACLRTLMAIYCFSTIIVGYSWLAYHSAPATLKDIHIPAYTLIQDRSYIAKSFSFFTFLTYWSLAFYFAVSASHTFVYAENLRRGRVGISWLHDSFPRVLQLLHSLWYTTITTFPFLVSVVFWCTMYGQRWPYNSPFEQWLNISVHGLNSLFAIIEILVSAIRPPPFLTHLAVDCMILSLYLGLSYLTKYDQGWYPYEWMNPGSVTGWKGIVGHVFGYAGAMVGIYALVWVAIWARERTAERRMMSRRESLIVMEKSCETSESELSSRPETSKTIGKEPVVEVQVV